jgi:hypothetical protein
VVGSRVELCTKRHGPILLVHSHYSHLLHSPYFGRSLCELVLCVPA